MGNSVSVKRRAMLLPSGGLQEQLQRVSTKPVGGGAPCQAIGLAEEDLSAAGPCGRSGVQLLVRATQQKHPAPLLSLSLEHCRLSDSEAAVLCGALELNAHLTRLSLRGNELSATGARAVADLLMSNGGVTVKGKGAPLSLVERQQSSFGLKLVTRGALVHLDLGANALGKGGATRAEGAEAIAEALKFNAVLASLSLADNGLNYAAAAALADAVRHNRTLTALDLARNFGYRRPASAASSRPASAASAASVASAMSVPKPGAGAEGAGSAVAPVGERVALLWAALLDTAGAAAAASAAGDGELGELGGAGPPGVKEPLSLVRLDLRGVDIGVAGGAALRRAFEGNSRVQALGVGSPGTMIEIGALRAGQTSALLAAGAGLGPGGAVLVAGVVRIAACLVELDLRSCGIGLAGGRAILASLLAVDANHTSPLQLCCGISVRHLMHAGRQHLDLEAKQPSHRLEIGGALILTHYLTVFEGMLCSLRLGNNAIGDAGKTMLGLALQRHCHKGEQEHAPAVAAPGEEGEGGGDGGGGDDDSGAALANPTTEQQLHFSCDEWSLTEDMTSLDLSAKALSAADAQLLGGVLPFACGLLSLDLSNNALGRLGLHKLCQALGTHPSAAPGCCGLLELAVADCGLDPETLANDVAPMLRRCTKLSVLVLCGNTLMAPLEAGGGAGRCGPSGNTPIDDLADAVFDHPSLSHLTCHEVELPIKSLRGEDATRALFLEMEGEFCTADAVVVGRLLQGNCCLETLRFAGYVDERGKSALGRGLIVNPDARLAMLTCDEWSIVPSTKSVDVSDIGVTVADAMLLSAVLKTNHSVSRAKLQDALLPLVQLRGPVGFSVHELDMSSKQLCCEDLIVAGYCLAQNRALLHLNLSDNCVGSGARPDALFALAAGVRGLASLQTLQLSNNHIGELPGTYPGVVELVRALGQSGKLAALDLSLNCLPGSDHENDDGLWALAEAIEHGMPSMTDLNLASNRLWHKHSAVADALATAIDTRTAPAAGAAPEHDDVHTGSVIRTIMLKHNCTGERSEWRSAGERIDVRGRAKHHKAERLVPEPEEENFTPRLEDMLYAPDVLDAGGPDGSDPRSAKLKGKGGARSASGAAIFGGLPGDQVHGEPLEPKDGQTLPFMFYFKG
jgi:hypothetical protein